MEGQTESDSKPNVSLETAGADTLVVQLSGAWRTQKNAVSAIPVLKALEAYHVRCVRFDAKALSSWDSSVLMFLMKVTELCRQQEIVTDREGLPDGIRRLLELAEIVPEQEAAKPTTDAPSFLARVGTVSTDVFASLSEMLHFLGDVTLTFVKLVRDARALPPRRSVAHCPGMRSAGVAHRHPHQLSHGCYLGVCRRGSAPSIRRPDLCGGPRRHRRRSRYGRHDDRNHHGGPDRRSLRRKARHDEGDSGNRRIEHARLLSVGVFGVAAHDRPLPDDASCCVCTPT